MRHRQKEAIKIARETRGDPPEVAKAYGVSLPEVPPEVPEEKGEGTDGS